MAKENPEGRDVGDDGVVRMIWGGVRVDVQLDGGDDRDENRPMREGIEDNRDWSDVAEVGKWGGLELGYEVIKAENEGCRRFPVIERSDAVDGL